MANERTTIVKLLEGCAETLTADGKAPFSRGDLIECVQRNQPRYGPDSINPIIQGVTVNLRGGASGAVGRNILYSVARGRFILYRSVNNVLPSDNTPEKSPRQGSTRPALSRPRVTKTILKLALERTMIVLPCSGRKAPSAQIRKGQSITSLIPRDLAGELIAQRAQNVATACIDESTVEAALNRYDGTLYQIGRSAIADLLRKGAQVLILSGGYGVVLAKEPIGMYDSKYRTSAWRDRIVERCLAAYARQAAVTTVVGIMSGSSAYAVAFRRTEWPTTISRILLVTPERRLGAMVKAPRAQGEALVAIADSGKLGDGWRSSDGLAMEITNIEIS